MATSNRKKRPYTQKRKPHGDSSTEALVDGSDGSDRSDADVVTDGQKSWDRPLGYDLDAPEYNGWQTWTPGQWAWEFLRRNKEFQECCNDVANMVISEEDCIEQFHLLRFKHYRVGYDNATPLFARSIFLFPDREAFAQRLSQPKRKGDKRAITFKVRDNEVVITFRLEPGTQVGEDAIDEQLVQARNRLTEYLAVLRAARKFVTMSKKHGDKAKGSKRLDPSALIIKLRALDLRKDSNKLKELALILNLKKSKSWGADTHKAAERLTKSGYLKLAFSSPAKHTQKDTF